jgi:hypothetical protein
VSWPWTLSTNYCSATTIYLHVIRICRARMLLCSFIPASRGRRGNGSCRGVYLYYLSRSALFFVSSEWWRTSTELRLGAIEVCFFVFFLWGGCFQHRSTSRTGGTGLIRKAKLQSGLSGQPPDHLPSFLWAGRGTNNKSICHDFEKNIERTPFW